MVLVYIARTVALYPVSPNLSVSIIQKIARPHHEVVSHFSPGLGTDLLSCNSISLWSKSLLPCYMFEV